MILYAYIQILKKNQLSQAIMSIETLGREWKKNPEEV